MYPRCLYEMGNVKPKWSCAQTVKLCQHDSYCSRSLTALNSSCPLSPGSAGGCVAKDFGECRLALIGVRGTDLESPCYCNKNDDKCMEYQNMVLPNHPCVEDSMIDFVAGGSVPTASDRQLSRVKTLKVHDSSRRAGKKLKNQAETMTTSSTTSTTTTVEPEPTENDIVVDGREEGEGEEEKQSESKEPVDEIEELEPTKSTTTTSKPPKVNATKASATKTSKEIKVFKTPGVSTAKMIIGQPLATQTPPPKEGLLLV